MAESQLSTARLEAFSDGVIAVIITIMVLELKVPALDPNVSNLEAFREVAPEICLYLLSFIQVGIYWVNHHYMMEDVPHVTHTLLWSNLKFLFTLSLFPFAASWVHTRHISPFSVALYAVCSVLPALSWVVLYRVIRTATGSSGAGTGTKQIVSTLLYLGAIPMAYASVWASLAMITAVAILWMLPPKEIREKTRALRQNSAANSSASTTPDSR